jgi:cobalt-precorrin 5A hydrolase
MSSRASAQAKPIMLMPVHDTLPANPTVVIGIGCRRDCRPAELIELLATALQEADLSSECIRAVATHRQKGDEPALNELAAWLQCELVLLEPAALDAMSARVSGTSAVAQHTLGVGSVAEASALACADGLGRGRSTLRLSKRKSANATLAIATVSEDA